MSNMVELNPFFTMQYLTQMRFNSFYYQISELMALEPESILEVGMGSGIVELILRQMGVEVTTLDQYEKLNPDILCSVVDIPRSDESFDVVACFQVLEHLPFDDFRIALKEIHRVAREHVVLSVPDCKPFFKMEITIPFLGKHRVLWNIPFRKSKNTMPPSHHWEVNRKGYGLKRVLGEMEQAGFAVMKTYRLWEGAYHRMFILKKVRK